MCDQVFRTKQVVFVCNSQPRGGAGNTGMFSQDSQLVVYSNDVVCAIGCIQVSIEVCSSCWQLQASMRRKIAAIGSGVMSPTVFPHEGDGWQHPCMFMLRVEMHIKNYSAKDKHTESQLIRSTSDLTKINSLTIIVKEFVNSIHILSNHVMMPDMSLHRSREIQPV